MALALTSKAFLHEGQIPAVHTCQGKDVSVPLAWSELPAGTRSLALIVDDPDAPDPAAPKMTWVHWVLYNIPPGVTGLPEDVKTKALPPGTLEGSNDQYISMVMEKTIAGPSRNPDYPNCASSSECTPYWLFPGHEVSWLMGAAEFGTPVLA